MNKKLFALLALMLVIAMCVFVACDNNKLPNGGNEHTHAYTQWAHDDTHHWKVCSCNDIDQSTKATHNFVDGVCECGATKPIDPADWERDQAQHWLLDDDGNVVASTKADHVYGTDAACKVCGRYSLKAQAMSVVYSANNYSLVLENCTLDFGTEIAIKVASAHIGLDENGKLYAWANLSATNDIYLPIDADDTTVTINLRYGVNFIVENDLVYLTVLSDSANSWNGYAVETTDGTAILPLEYVVDMLFEEVFDIDITYTELKTTISNVLAQLDSYSETAVALYKYICSLGTDSGDVLADADSTELSFVSVTTDEDGTKTYTVNFDALRPINQFLATTTIGDLLESLVGENYATVIPAAVEDAFDITVGELITLAETQAGMTLDDLIAIANQIVAMVMDDNTVTIDSLLTQAGVLPEGSTVKELLSTDLVKAYTMANLLAMAQQGAESPVTVEQIVSTVSNVINNAKDMSIYEFVIQGMMMDDDATETSTYGESIGAIVDDVIDVLNGYLHVTVNVDKDGVMQSTNIRLGFDDDFVLDDDSSMASLAVTLAQVNGTISVKRDVEFENADDFIKDAKDNLGAVTDALAKNSLKDKETVTAFVKSALLWDDKQEIVSLEKNTDGDWILTIKGYHRQSRINNEGILAAVKEALEWTDNEIQGLAYGYVYTATINLNKDFSVLTFWNTACNGKRYGEISAPIQRKIEGVYIVGTDYYAYNWKTEPISAEQLATVLEILENGVFYYDSIYDISYVDTAPYDWLTSGYLTVNTSTQRYIDCIYDSVNKTIVVDPGSIYVHKWETVTEIDTDDLPCGYYTKITQKCSHCNATRDLYIKGECKNFKWSEPEGTDCEGGRKTYKYCTECGKNVDYTYVYGHTYEEGVIAEGDCTSAEGVSYRCTVCGEEAVYKNYDDHAWQSCGVQTYGSVKAEWLCCKRCTTGKHWEISFDSDIGWAVEEGTDKIVYTTNDETPVVIAEIDDVFYIGYNKNDGTYQYRLDNETGTVVAYADDQVAA